MKFSSSTHVLFALVASSSSLLIQGGKNDPPKVPIDTYELLAAGQPYGEVFTLEPFSAKVYYEAKTDAKILTDVYSDVTAGSPCSSGTNITNINTTLIASGPAYNTATSDGNINSVELTTADIKSTGAYMAVGANDGKVNLCVRSYLTADYDSSSSGDEVVSFVDTQIELNVDFTAKFQNFTQEVNITATTSKDFTQNITKNVEVESFLCASGSNPATSYKIGQDFSVCVRPTLEFSNEGYVIDGFVNVTCENSAASRALLSNYTPDALTTVKKAPQVSGYLDGAGQTAGGAAAAFESVVTAGYFSSNENSFTCSGDASLYYPSVCYGLNAKATGSAVGLLSKGICLNGISAASGATLERIVTHLPDANKNPEVFMSPATTVNSSAQYYYGEHTNTVRKFLEASNDCTGAFFPAPFTLGEYGVSQFESVEFKFNLDSESAGKTYEICYLSGDSDAQAISSEWESSSHGQVRLVDELINFHPMNWYCTTQKFGVNEKGCDSSGRKLETVSFKDTYGFSRSVQDASTTASPFAAKIGLNSEGTEAITASSAVIYDGLVSIAMFGVSLFLMLCDVM